MGKFEFKSGALDDLIKSADVQALVMEKANAIAANVRASGLNTSDGPVAGLVEVRAYQTDRAAAEVRINHPAGMALEAKHGVLTRAIGG